MKESEMVLLMMSVIAELKAGGNTSKFKAEKAEEFGLKFIDFFRQNPDIDAKALSEMSLAEFGKRMAEFCGDKRVKGITSILRKVFRITLNDKYS